MISLYDFKFDFVSVAIEFFLLSRNFGELPVGSVCVADVQYKGRGMELIAVTCLVK